MGNFFEKQWHNLMNKSPFSEEVQLIMPNGEIKQIQGTFYAGTYAKENYAPYQSERLQGEERDYLSVPLLSLSSLFGNPKDEIKDCKIVTKEGNVFVIHATSGKSKGNLSLMLMESELEEGENE